MTTTTYASDLGKCYAEAENGKFRAYKDGGMFRVYLCGKEMNFDANYNFIGYGKRIEASGMTYFTHLDDFLTAVEDCKDELNYLMAAGA